MMYEIFALISLFLLPLRAAAAPADHVVLRRNVCDGVDDMPVLYHEYRESVCPPKYTMDSKGVCDHTDFRVNFCAAFCQVRTYFVHGKELPFEDTYCRGPCTCSVTNPTKTISWSVNVDSQFEKGLNDGITGGWQSSIIEDVGPGPGMSFSIELDDGQCGYFSFVPIVKTVW